MPIPSEVKATLRTGYRLVPQSKVVWNGTLTKVGGVDVGFVASTGVELGILADLKFNYTPNFVPITAPDLGSAAYIEIGSEDLQIVTSIYDFNPTFLTEFFPASKSFYDDAIVGSRILVSQIGRDYSGQNVKPLVIEFTNIQQPSSPGVQSNGISGGILTIYKALFLGSFNLDINAQKSNSLQLTFRAQYDYQRDRKSGLGSIYLY